jgi:hypothetical protein
MRRLLCPTQHPRPATRTELEAALDECREVVQEAARRGLSASSLETFLAGRKAGPTDEEFWPSYLSVWRRHEAKVLATMNACIRHLACRDIHWV